MHAIQSGQHQNDRPPQQALRALSGGRTAVALLLALAVGFGIASLMTSRPHATPAAAAQTVNLADSPFFGVWRFVDDVGDPLGDNYGLFHADGTFVGIGVNTTFLGLWRPTGENAIEVMDIHGGLGFVSEPFVAGTQLTRTTLTYDPATDSLSGIYSPTLSDASGEVIISGARYSVRGYRVSFETMFPATPTP